MADGAFWRNFRRYRAHVRGMGSEDRRRVAKALRAGPIAFAISAIIASAVAELADDPSDDAGVLL